MSTTPENDATTWRELTDKLTPQQSSQLDGYERDPHALVRLMGNPALSWTADALLRTARGYAGNNLGAAMIGETAPPAAPSFLDEWVDADTDAPYRCFRACGRVVPADDSGNRPRKGIEVYVSGLQRPDGTVERDIVVHQLHADNPITLQQARLLGEALIAAVDDAAQITG
jgi:hypothetical protein